MILTLTGDPPGCPRPECMCYAINPGVRFCLSTFTTRKQFSGILDILSENIKIQA